MQKLFYIFLIILLLLNMTLFGYEKSVTLNHSENNISISQEGIYTHLSYLPSQFKIIDYDKPGYPEIPFYTYNLLIPEDRSVEYIEVNTIQEKEIPGSFLVFPIQEIKSINEAKTFTNPNLSIYQDDRKYPERVVLHSFSGNYNGYRISTFKIYPLRYNPVTQKIYLIEHVDFTIHFKQNTNLPVRPVRLYSRDIESIESTVKRLVENKNEVSIYKPQIDNSEEKEHSENNNNLRISSTPSENGLSVKYLIITTDEFAVDFEPLTLWKNKKGVPAVTKSLQWIKNHTPNGIDDAETIRNFIKWAYQKWGTKYVLFGGDIEYIPTRTIRVWGYDFPTDYYYAELDGNWNYNQNSLFGEVGDSIDVYPEVYVARLPVSNTNQVNNVVNKILKYEKLTSVTNPEYPNNFLFMAANLWNDGDAQGFIDDYIVPNISPTINKTFINETNHIGSDPQVAINYLNSNYGLVYSDNHGSYNLIRPGAKGSEMFSYDLDNLDNSDLSIWYASTCNGNDISKNCFGEHYVLNQGSGGVGYIGNSAGDYPHFSSMFHGEFYNQIFNLNNYNLSHAHFESRLPYLQWFQMNYMTRLCHLSTIVLGDPELPIWTAAPGEISVTTPELVVGENNVQVSVDILSSKGTQVQDFLVVFYKEGEIYEMAYTDGSGIVNFNFQIQSQEDVYLTVTKHNYKPYEATLSVGETETAHLLQTDYHVADNNNGMPEAGETAELYLIVENNGVEDAEEVEITLSCNDNFVTVNTNHVFVESIPAGETIELEDPFIFSLNADMPVDTTISLHLSYTIGKGELIGEEDLYLSSGCADVYVIENILQTEISKQTVPAESKKFEDGFRQGPPSSSSYLTLSVFNSGKGAARSVNGTITCSDPGVDIINSTVDFPDIAAGGTAQSLSSFVFEHSVEPSSIIFNLTLTDAYNKTWNSAINLSTPTQPDSFASEPYDENSVLLTWQASTSADVLGYYLDRRISGQGNFSRITGSPVTNGGYYHDAGLSAYTSYDYKLFSVDSSGNLSEADNTLTAWSALPVQQNFPLFTSEQAVGSEGNGVITYDFDSDGTQEIVATGANGFIKIYNHDGTVYRTFSGLEGELNIPQ